MKESRITLRQIEQAGDILRGGGIVALPSETVYGLGARADHEAAIKRIFEAKGRPNFNPLILHVTGIEMAQKYVKMNEKAQRLAKTFWPGALSLVLPKHDPGFAIEASAGLDTLAIRAPAHPVFHAVIEHAQIPIAAPSANQSGRLSPTNAEHVKRDLEGKVDYILDAGACEYGLESTVLMPEDERVWLLRHGAIPKEILEEALGEKIWENTKENAPKSPGQLLRHYAPNTPIILNSTQSMCKKNDYWLGFGDGSEFDLSPSSDLREAAHRLFDLLGQLDELAKENTQIHVAPIPAHGIGAAINDRLERAAQSVIK